MVYPNGIMDTGPPPDHWRDALVLLLAHGSETTPGATNLAKDHASQLKSSGRFADVRAVFLRDTPHPRHIIDQSPHTDIYIVPFMISEGYSIQTLIPTALGLSGPLTERISKQGRRRIHVCHSIGTHSLITNRIVTSVSQFVTRHDLDAAETSALVIAHGTKRHPGNNRQSTYLADCIARRCCLREAHAVFLEEAPFIGDWHSLTTGANVLAIPYLMTIGSHATNDVPRAVGISPETRSFHDALHAGETFGPVECDQQQLWYAPVIGHSGSIPDIVVDRIRDWDRAHQDKHIPNP